MSCLFLVLSYNRFNMFEFFKSRQDKEPVGLEFAEEARRAYEQTLRTLEDNSKDS